MIVVCDVNEIWRKKPFAALAEKAGVIGISPADWFVARRAGFESSEGPFQVVPVLLPPSWASRLALIGQRILWNRIVAQCRKVGSSIDVLVVTSPHYLPLLNMIPKEIKTIYYASDDYRSYEGWGQVATLEQKMVERVDHAFFVSQGLMDRARKEYGVDPAKLSVSMNATEDRFISEDGSLPVTPPQGRFKRPIAGVVGGINERLDFDMLFRCAELPELGTLLLVGPVPEEPSPSLTKLLKHPKCVSVGRQPHESIHEWFQCLDVGLIPYIATEFNRMCSPMRLFDHLASGAPIVTTAACDQANAFKGRVSVCEDTVSFVAALADQLGVPRACTRGIGWNDRARLILEVIEEVRDA